ncbi:MAG: methylmalonyl Co-A mutase-associated GTPase MeaB [Desulfobacteraceae bacterium]|nr:methylmalonyl Co-A mutase-associated GTPase MeaB [Desulfobacteraceae bacterium]
MKEKDPEFFIQGVLKNNRRIIAKTITLIESSLARDKKVSFEIVKKILPYSGKSIRLGITGIPGVGKSTFIENLGLLLANSGHKVAVLAVDPTSRKSGGSILGDKTRMEKLAAHENTFIRPSPAGKTLGGVAAKTREAMLVCEAAGYDTILVETVGVGQSETKVSTMVDFFLVLLIAGAGDELQGIKKGILEIADALAINKADNDNIDKANKAKKIYEMALHFLSSSSSSWNPPVVTCSSILENGTENVWKTVIKHNKLMKRTGEFDHKRKEQAVEWMWNLVDDGLKKKFMETSIVKKEIPKISKQVKQGLISPSAAAEELLSYFNYKNILIGT